MPEKTFKTAVVIIPPQSLWEPIQAIRLQHDSKYHRWMPHITLLYPFRPRQEFENLLPAFLNRCQESEPFSLTISKVRSFRHPRDQFTFWLAPEPAEAIQDLQARLLSLAPDCSDVNHHQQGFTPHMSLGQIRGRQQHETLLSTLSQSWIPLQFTVREICFIAREDSPQDPFSIVYRIPLHSDSTKGDSWIFQ